MESLDQRNEAKIHIMKAEKGPTAITHMGIWEALASGKGKIRKDKRLTGSETFADNREKLASSFLWPGLCKKLKKRIFFQVFIGSSSPSPGKDLSRHC